ATVSGIRDAQDATRRTAGAFESLQKSLGQIDQILVFIDDVTNRTNLLSLNAAIIAAQAGANDFGFSVIADEVRQLAERTRSATKEIAGIVRNLKPVATEALHAIEEGVRNVDTTVLLASDTSKALESIAESATESFDMAQMMTRALNEQSEASHHLHQVTSRMSDSIREIERATQGQANAMGMLASESESVRDIAVGVKKSTEEQSAASVGIAHAMEQIVADVRLVRDRLERQLKHSEEIAGASQATLAIAGRNNSIAQEFTSALQALVASGQEFDTAVKRFRA
ncbi:MAG: methyl-accepting chemotaxis protein, partial [Thermoanaerobaculia bacterium]